MPDTAKTPVANSVNSPVIYVNNNPGITSSGTTPQSTANSTLGASCPVGPVLPGLMNSATNALGDSAQWGYDSLALGSLCTRDGQPEYSVTGNAANLREYYFASSMPVVSAMLQSDGMGGNSGSRSMAYSYNQAMYNHFGRGFQGFQAITAENLSTDKKRRLLTTTQFNQFFPLTGKPIGITTVTAPSSGLGTGSHTIHSEIDTYQCATLTGTTQTGYATCKMGANLAPLPTGGTVFQPVLSAQTTADFDLVSGAASSHTTTANTSWDAYANLLNQSVSRYDDTAGGTFVSSHVTTTSNVYPTPTLGTWTINLPQSSTVTSSITYASGHPVPAAALSAGATGSPTVTTGYTWNADRTLAQKTVTSTGSNPQAATPPATQLSTTTYSYPVSPAISYGLPIQVEVTDATLGNLLSPMRATNYTYTNTGSAPSADGYFVYTTTRYPNFPTLTPAQITTTTHQPSDGQTLVLTDPNGLKVSTTYDVFGRATQIQHLGTGGAAMESPINIAYNNCSGGSCTFLCTGNQACTNPGIAPGNAAYKVGEDITETYATYRVTTTQAGYPTQVVWADALGRSVKQAEAGFSGTTASALTYNFIASLTDYDQNGTVQMQSTPYQIPQGSAAYTTLTYDALNRVTSKSAPASCGGTMATTYAYVGRQTNITASSTCPSSSTGPIYMSRSTNVLGQLMQTVDANGNDVTFTKGKTTSYWTEPQGHVAAMTDVEGNQTYALYNALGQRTASKDPDQGLWTFTYDAFGELLTQTDARNVVTAVLQRDALGRQIQRTETPTGSVPGLAANVYNDTWSYDPNHGVGEVGTIARQRGATLAAAQSSTAVWQESYTYDATTARLTKTATGITEGGSATTTLTTQLGYDAAGHLSQQTYPSGLIVDHGFTAYGQENVLSNHTTQYVYWTAQAENEWKHVTQEQFPGLITGTHADFDATGQTQTLSWAGVTADEFDYQYDGFGNLTQQIRSKSAGYTENYVYDALQRLTSATRNGVAVSYKYSASGNLTTKSDYSAGSATDYTYGGSGCGPHAATSVNLAGSGLVNYTCDANGNVIGGTSATSLNLTYDADNRPWTGARGTGPQDAWSYSPTGQLDYETSSRGTRYYGPMGYEQLGAQQIHELGPVIVTRNAGVDTVSVVLRDRLGSTVNVIDNNTPTTRSYDAFGKPILGNGNLLSPPALGLADTIHGFTKHEHDDDVLLINTVGRLYDFQLGRFLQVDPVIDNPANSQAINPYSYIGNNPLSGVDPTGYQAVVDSCTAATGTHICGVSTSAGSSTVSGHETTTDASGKTTTTTFTGTLDGNRLTSVGVTSVSNAAVSQGVKGPGGQNTQSVDATSAGNPNAAGNGVQSSGCGGMVGMCHAPDTTAQRSADLERDARTIARGVETAATFTGVGGMAVSGYEFLTGKAPLSGDDASRGWAAAGLLPFGKVIKYGEEILEDSYRAYRSFSAFKYAEGAAGDGMEWHHIVEQTRGNVARFGAQDIHNTENLIRLDKQTHRQVSGFYSSIQDFSQGQTVRQWLAPQSFGAQREFGLGVLQRFGEPQQ